MPGYTNIASADTVHFAIHCYLSRYSGRALAQAVTDTLTATVTVTHKASQAMRPLLMYCAFPIRVPVTSVSSTRTDSEHQIHPVAKQEKLREKWP
jgi:hypothetical protein